MWTRREKTMHQKMSMLNYFNICPKKAVLKEIKV
jgi:hypothetical protein